MAFINSSDARAQQERTAALQKAYLNEFGRYGSLEEIARFDQYLRDLPSVVDPGSDASTSSSRSLKERVGVKSRFPNCLGRICGCWQYSKGDCK